MLKTIFDLPTSKDDLEASNNGFSNWKWLQKAALRNITDTDATQNFNKGVITYRWDLSSSTWFYLCKSFLRMRCSISRADGTPLEQSDGVGGSMGLIANLISEMNFTINDQLISIADRHCGELEAIYTRINKSGQWMRDIGQSTNFWSADLEKRIQDVSIDGTDPEFYGGSDLPTLNDRDELGLPGDTTIQYTGATGLMVIDSAGSPFDVRDFYQPGDIIQVADNLVNYRQAFYVVRVPNSNTIQTANFGTTAADIVQTNDANWIRYRYSKAEVIVAADNVITQPSYAPGNILAANAGNLANAKAGIVSLLAPNGTTEYRAQTIIANTGNLTARGSSFNVQTDLAADPGNIWYYLQYERTQVISLADEGYIQNDQNNGHAVLIEADPNNDALLTITAVNDAPTPPPVSGIFKTGDIVTAVLLDGTTFQGLVTLVAPNNQENALRVVGSDQLAADRGADDDGRNYLFNIIRHRGGNPSDQYTNNARNVTDVELTWTPRCLSIFRWARAMPGGAKFQLNITPKNLYREAAVETLTNKVAGVDYNFKVQNMFFYIPTFEGAPYIDKKEFYIDLNEIRCQKVPITSQETSYSLDVRPSTNAVAIAVQSSSVDNNTNFSSSKFTCDDDYHLQVRELECRYGAEQKPIPRFDINYDETDGIDYWNEVYIRNLLATNGYFDSSGETIQEFYKRGNYWYCIYNKDGSDRETRIYVTLGFNEPLPAVTQNLLLFNFYKKYCIVKIENGRYQEVMVNEA